MTNPKGKRWWCFSENVFDNMKTATLPGEDFKGWCHLITLAQRLDEEGLLPNISQIAFAMRFRSDSEVISLLERLSERSLIDRKPGGERGVRFWVHDFSEWQGSSRPYKETLTKSPRRAREPTLPTFNLPNLPTARVARAQEDIFDFTKSEMGKGEPAAEAPILDLRREPVAEAADDEAQSAEVFRHVWTSYLEFGDSRSPLDKAEAAWRQLPELDQYSATEGLVIWGLLEAIAKRGDPERKIKYLDTWLNGRMWQQYSPKNHPKFAGTANKLMRRWWRLDEPAKRGHG